MDGACSQFSHWATECYTQFWPGGIRLCHDVYFVRWVVSGRHVGSPTVTVDWQCRLGSCVWASLCQRATVVGVCGRPVVGWSLGRCLWGSLCPCTTQNCQLSPPHCRLSYHAQQINHSLPITHVLYVPVPGCSHPCTVSQETQQKHDWYRLTFLIAIMKNYLQLNCEK